MANNDGFIDVISKIKPANRGGFKVADSSDIEYPKDGKINKGKNVIVDNANDAIDALYDIISATPTFYLISNSKIPSNGSDRVYVQVGTSSPQGNTVKITVTNKTTGGSTQYTGPINSVHSIDLGVITTYGTYEYSITAVDNYNNAMVVDTTKSSTGSFNEEATNDQYQLTFNIVAGSIKYGITSIDKVVDSTSPAINDSTKIYEANKNGNVKFDINVTGSLQYPEINSDNIEIKEYAKYSIKTRCVYMYYAETDEYIPVYKYLTLVKIGLLNELSSYNLFYKTSTDDFVSVDVYNLNEFKYPLNEYDSSVGIFYDFVENTNGEGEFIKITNGNETRYEYKITETSLQTYDLIPVYNKASFYDVTKGELNEYHLKSSENLYFTIPDVYFINEGKYTISVISSIEKTYTDQETELLESIEISSNVFPIYIERDSGNNTISLRVIPVSDITNANTDQDLSASFILVSSHNRIKSNIKFKAQLFFRPDETSSSNDLLIKNIIREGCPNLSEQIWTIGRVSKGTGHYYYIITPTSYDGSLVGTPYEYHFIVDAGSSATTNYTQDSLVAYWDAVKMSNDMKNPSVWYPTIISGNSEVESNDFYIKLFGLNYNTNGWVQYDENNKHPHLKFTGDSYGLAYRLNAAGEEEPLSVIDLLDTAKIPQADTTKVGKEMSFEIMFKTRCVGEMKACVVSSREEESRTLSLYTYSDTDEQRANSGITISHNKAIINTNKDYISTPFNSEEWKHVVFTVNRNINTVLADKSGTNYNPFSSMKIYVDGILTSVTDIPANDTDSNNVFDRFTQLVLNGHKGLNNIIENCGSSEIRLIRMYNKALSNTEVVNNFINSIYDIKDRTVYETKNSSEINTIPVIYFVRNSTGSSADADNIRKKDTENSTFNKLVQITDKQESKKYFVNCTMYYSYPDPDNANEMITKTYNNVDVYLQGTSTLQFPVKNFKIRTYKNTTTIDTNTGDKIIINGGKKNAEKKLKFIPPNMADEWVEDSVFTLKCDYMESGHLNNTPTAKFYHHVVRELVDARIDGSNPDIYPISKTDYRYQQDNEKGTYYIDKDCEYKPIENIATFTGTKYKPIAITEKNSASPSRSYFAFYENDDGTIFYTSALDRDETYGNLNYIDSSTNIIYKTLTEVTSSGLNVTDVKAFYHKPNRYYIRMYNSSFDNLEWVEYDPTNINHYEKILYKINDMYRDSIDGFPCIVYYTDTYMGYTNDAEQAQIDGNLKLLGTMMFNLDKTAKSIGFTVNPIFENEYDEYLRSYYKKYLETEQAVIDGISTVEEFIEYAVNGIYNEEKIMFINSYNTSNEGINQYIQYSVPTLLKFEEFYNKEEYKYKKIKIDEDYESIFDNNVNEDYARCLYGKCENEYILYPNLTPEQLLSLKNLSSKTDTGDVWYTKEIDEDNYATMPVYTYNQYYVEALKDNGGNYYYDEYEKDYLLADDSFTGTRYKQVFDDFRTYNTDENNNLYRITDQCVLSYEATTNTKYAAGTFYDIDEAYNMSYSDDFLNQYYTLYFMQPNGITPKLVKMLNNDGTYTELSPKLEDNSMISLEDLKSNLLKKLNMEAIVLSDWTNKDFFYLDETKDANQNVISTDPGPYVYVVNEKVTKKDTDGGEFVLYDKSVHGLTTEDESNINNYRYKFGLKFISSTINYSVSSDGTYYYDSDTESYKLIPSGSSFTGTKYSRTLTGDTEFIINDKRSYIGDKLNGSDDSYLDYMMGSFETRFSYIDENDITNDNMPSKEKDNNSWLPLKRLMKWIINSVKNSSDITSDDDKNIFKKEFRDHFDLTYTIVYYLQMILFAQADNAGKNSMWDTWDGKTFYIRPYDMDTQSGLNNKGLFNVPTSAEVNSEQSPTEFTDNTSTRLGNISNRLTDHTHLRYNSYTTATSRFWNTFAKAFKKEIQSAYAILRNSGMYTTDYILNYYKSHVTDCIGEKYYNNDMNAKYLSQTNLDYLGLLMGNRLDQFSKWISERIIFCDTYFNYIENDTLNTQLDIRAQTTNSTAAIGISVFSPQYVKISVGSTRDAVFTAFVDNSSTYIHNGIEYEGVLFTLPITGNNKEISIYGGGNIKEINNIGDLKASTLNLGNARKITKLEISGNNYIESLSLANAVYLRSLNVSNCSKLTGNLDVSNSINLQALDISSSALSGVTLAAGGNLKSFIARNTSITSIEFINLQQLTDIIISNSSGLIPISTYSMVGCPLIKTINLDGFTNISRVNINDCTNLSALYIEGNQSLSELSITNCDGLHVISLKNTSGSVLENLQLNTVYGLDKLDITSCRPANGIHINFPYFKDGETADNVDPADMGYFDRWHNLKYLLCTNSTLKSVSYGTNDDNNTIVDLSPLDMLKYISFISCDNIVSIKGLKYTGNPAMFQYCTSLVNIEDSFIYRTTNNLANIFYGCAALRDFSSLNINQYSKYNDSTSLSQSLRYAYSTEPMLKSLIYSGRDYTLTKNTDNLTGITSYNLRDYLVRDVTPHYSSIRLIDDNTYVYDKENDEFIEYDTYTHNKSLIKNYNKENDNNLLAKYYKVYASNGSNKFINDRFGLYLFTKNDKNSDSNYFIKVTNIDHELVSGETLNSLSSSYKVDGTIVKNGSLYYRYFNNAWQQSYLYSFFDINTLDVNIVIDDIPIPVPGGIYTTHSESEGAFLFYTSTSQSPYNVYTSNKVNPLYEYVDLERYSIASTDIDNINYKYYRIYNNTIDDSSRVLKKKYNSTSSTKYISSINSICYGRANNRDSLSINDDTFNGLDRCTTASTAFYSSGLTNISHIAFQQLKNLTSARLMFASTGLTNLRKEMFLNSSKLTDCKSMFRGCDKLRGFYDSNSNRSYYNTDSEGNITSILPSCLIYMQQMFQDCTELRMENNDLNGFLSNLSNVEFAWAAFRDCTNIRNMRNKPLKDMISVKDISSMFCGCTNLNVQNVLSDGTLTTGMLMNDPNNEFSIVDTNINYPNLTLAYSLFYNCTNLSGFISKYIFAVNVLNPDGSIKARSGAYNISKLGCDFNIVTTQYDTNGHISTEGSSAPVTIGGAFANTSINNYHEEFLSPLKNLTDVTALFAKIFSTGTICKNNEYINLCTAMYGYGRSDENNNITIIAGIPERLFEFNTKLENASYLFAGNKGLERSSSELSNSFTVYELPEIFKYCPNIKYLIGVFMCTTVHSSNLDSDTNGLIMNEKYYIYNKTGSIVKTDVFFKYYDEDSVKYIGFNKLISIKSIFENSNYTIYDSKENASKISKDIFTGCTSLIDVSRMFRHNELVSGENIIPIELFDDCRNTLKDTSYMFQGCCGKPGDSSNLGITGFIPTGDNTWLLAYNKYLENIKNDPDVISVYPNLGNLSVGQLFDALLNNQYKDLPIVLKQGTTMRLLDFNEFMNNNTIYKLTNEVSLTNILDNKNIIKSDGSTTLPLESGFYVKQYSNGLSDKYTYSGTTFAPISKIEDAYFEDRMEETLPSTTQALNKYLGTYVISNAGNLVQLTTQNISTYRGKTVNRAIYGEIGIYGLSDGSYELIRELGSSYDGLRYVKRTKISLPSSKISDSFITSRQIFNIYECVKSNTDDNFIITTDNNGLFTPIYKNRRVLDINGLVTENIDKGYYEFYINGDSISQYELSETSTRLYYLASPILCSNIIYNADYHRGLLGSCSSLENTSHMFEGCLNISGRVPRDIFSAESPSTYLSKLTNISYMFSGCPLLSTQFTNNKNNVIGNPITMYSRDDNYNLNTTGDWLVPEDWLSYAINIEYVERLFSRIATFDKEIVRNRPSVNDNSSITKYGSVAIPNMLFSGLRKVKSISYIFYGSPLLVSNIGNEFLRDSLSSLTDISFAFSHTTLTSIGMSDIRIFELSSLNNKLENVSGAFFNCARLNNNNSYYPRFGLSSKFNKIILPANKSYCFSSTGFAESLPTEYSLFLGNGSTDGWWYENKSGYYITSLSLESLSTILSGSVY